MLDAACPGEVFTSPVPDQMLAATKAVDGGAGVIHIVKNYTGDVMNFKLAAEDAADEGISVESVLVDDDVAVEDSLYTAGRRGVGATVLLEKIAGAAAERGDALDAVTRVARRVNDRARSFGVALSSCTPPASGQPMFDLPDGQMEVGIGIHGEPGRRRAPIGSAHEIAGLMVEAVLSDLQPQAGADVLAFVNGMGGTPQIELYLLYGEIEHALRAAGVRPRPPARRQLHHVAGDGGRVADGARTRPRPRGPVGCSGAHAGAPLGSVTQAMDTRMQTAVDSTTVTAWMGEIAAAVRAERDHLTQLDAAIGDGDHGDQHEPRLRGGRRRRSPCRTAGCRPASS